MKRCICCHEQKRLTEFYPHPQMRDGHLNKCKGCVIAYGRERRKDPVVAQKLAAYERARMQTPKRKAQRKAFFQRYALRHPDKYDARDIVNNALRDGRLVRQPCAFCGDTNTEAHHQDYTRPLDVTWLCFRHHRELAHNHHVNG